MEATDTAVKQPRTPAELLRELRFLSLHKPRSQPTMSRTTINRTTEKFKPLTVAELNAEMDAFRGTTGKKQKTAAPTTVSAASAKKKWNSSIKVDKMISHTGGGQMKHNAVRKQLYTRSTMADVETPKFPKPVSRVKKAPLPNQGVRISGICKFPETPTETTIPTRSRPTIANKENVAITRIIPKLPNSASANRKARPSPKKVVRFRKSIAPRLIHIPDTPQSNNSSESTCDASFLQKEKEIYESEQGAQAIVDEQTLEKIAEVSPPISTPFNEYRNVQEYFNNTSDMETSVNDDTIMCFDKPPISKDNLNIIREESVIVSLCDLFNKAAVSNLTTNKKAKTDQEILKEIKQEIQNNMKSQLKLLTRVNKLIQKNQNGPKSPITFADKTLTDENNIIPKIEITSDNTSSPCKSPILGRPCSTSKSLSYKILKKNSCLRKKNIYKSMPEISNRMQSPKALICNNDRAKSMYLDMKTQIEFLKTPVAKERPAAVLDTPAITKNNIQVQLDKLFNNS